MAERQGNTELADFFKSLRAKEEKKLWDQDQLLLKEEEDQIAAEKKHRVPGMADLRSV